SAAYRLPGRLWTATKERVTLEQAAMIATARKRYFPSEAETRPVAARSAKMAREEESRREKAEEDALRRALRSPERQKKSLVRKKARTAQGAVVDVVAADLSKDPRRA